MISGEKKLPNHSGVRAAAALVMFLTIAINFVSLGNAAGVPKTVAELALYQGPDRGKILIEGAKKEGRLSFYNSHTWLNTEVIKEFEKKYPFIKVSGWRSDVQELSTRVMEEYAAGRSPVDVIETPPPAISILHKAGIFQEYYSPEMSYYGDESKQKGKTGVYYLADREIYIGLGFNTKLIPPAEAPRTLKDLLDPKWKGKISITGSTTGPKWLGNALEAMGRDFIEKLSRQDVRIQNISGAAMATLITSGEVPLSPTIFDSNILTAKEKGAPVEWRPLEPVITNVGYSGMTTRAPHPHGALLFLDYLHSREGQKLLIQGGLSSPREDMGTLEQKFKKSYLDDKYTIEEYEKKFNEWQKLMEQLFIKKR